MVIPNKMFELSENWTQKEKELRGWVELAVVDGMGGGIRQSN